jgi:hypothetical protein
MEGDGANSTCVALYINRYRAKGLAMDYTRLLGSLLAPGGRRRGLATARSSMGLQGNA